MCGQSTAYNTYATLSYTNPLFMGFSGYQNVNKEIIFTIQSVLWRLRKVYYTSEFRFRGVFLVCELWYYYNVMIFQKVKREI